MICAMLAASMGMRARWCEIRMKIPLAHRLHDLNGG